MSNDIVKRGGEEAERLRAHARATFVARHGTRVRRATAMELLSVQDAHTFRKVVDANPQLVHCLPGESQPRYLTVEIFALLPTAAWCATRGQEKP